MKNQFLQSLLVVTALFSFISCEESSSKEETLPTVETKFVLGVEVAPNVDVLVASDSIHAGEISPKGTGVEFPQWMSFYQAGKMIITEGYSSNHTVTGYALSGENGKLVSKGSLVTDQGLYATANVDDATFIGIGATRAGFEPRTIFTIDKNDMSIAEKTETRIDERKELDLVAFPTGAVQRDDKLYVSYFLTGTGAVVPAFSTPMADTAKIAVYSYPSMEFEKIIRDKRTSEIGRYLDPLSLQVDENGDIYTVSTSSQACGFLPTPDQPSGFLRIKKGASTFDDSYFFNFSEKSGGYKLNSAIYAGNGKMVVRVVMSDAVHWSAYGANLEESQLHLAYMIADLNAQTVTPISGIPMTGGAWGIAHAVKDGKVYVNVSNINGSSIYEIDPVNATAKQGATVVGHYTKAIFNLPVQD